MNASDPAAELVNTIECSAGEPVAIPCAIAPVYRQVEVVCGATIILMGNKGTQLFRFDFAGHRNNNAIEFYVLDESRTRMRSIVVGAEVSASKIEAPRQK